MHRTAVLVAAVAVAVFAVVNSAPASQEAVAPKRVAALEKKVKALQKDLDTLATFTLGCVASGAAPLTSAGDPAAARGYVYNDAAGQIVTSAIRLTAQGETPTMWMPKVDPRCAAILNRPRQAMTLSVLERYLAR